MNKLRLDYFLSLGLKLVVGDKFYVRGDSPIVTEFNIVVLNSKDTLNNERFITLFAPRKNTGAKRCDDSAPWIWNNQDSSWKPDLNELIKMQNKNDKEQGK